jgi:hypothetical protein
MHYLGISESILKTENTTQLKYTRMLNKFIFQVEKILEQKLPNLEFTDEQLPFLHFPQLRFSLNELKERIYRLRNKAKNFIPREHSKEVKVFFNEFLISIRKTELNVQ